MMEWPSGHEASSGCRASRKRRTNFARQPDPNPEPRTVGQNPPTNLAGYAGGRVLRSRRLNVHLNKPPGFESYGLSSESRMSSGENHEDGSREPFLDSGHFGNQSKLKQLKRKTDSITQPPFESHMRSDKNHEDGSSEPFLESGCLGNQEKLIKLKRKLDSITPPLHTKAALQIASGSRVTATRRSSNVVDGCAALKKQKLGTDHDGKRPHREEGHNNHAGVPTINTEHTTSSASSDSSSQRIPSGVPITCLQNPFTSSPSSPQSQPICSTPQPTSPPMLPSESQARSGENHEDGWGEPFLESGSGNQYKLKELKHKQDSITQLLQTESALRIESGSMSVSRRSPKVVVGLGALQKQKSGTGRGQKHPCREEGHSKDSDIAPMISERTTSSASADSSSQLFPSIFPYTCDKDTLTSLSTPQSQLISTPQPTAPLMLPPSNYQRRDITIDFGSRQLTSAACNKPFISPDGTGFYPDPTEVAHCITSIIQHSFDGPWPTWKKIPITKRDQWFEEFQKRYYWKPEHTHQVRVNFEARGKARLRDFFCMARRNVNVRPVWVSSEVWDALKQYWDCPEFKSRSEQAKINRASDCGGLGPSKHTCGSIPMTEHKRRLEEKTGEEVTPIKLFVHTHQRKDKTWVDGRSAQAYEKFMKEWNKLHPSQPASQLSGSEGEGQTLAQTSAQATQPADPVLAEAEVWVKTNSTKRGTIYGLGSEAVKYKSIGSSNPSTSEPIRTTTPNWFDTPEFQQFLSQKVTEVSSEWNARLEQERLDTEELRRRVAELEREKEERKKKKKAKKKLNQMKEMMKMLQKQYESLSKGQPSSDDDDEGSSDSDY